MELGDPKYRILNMVLSRKNVRLDEIASMLVLDMAQAMKYVEFLQAEGEVELRDGTGVLPAAKYRELKVPKNEWPLLNPPQIFDELGRFVNKTDDTKSIIIALETAADVLEQKIARGGTLIFQMRKTADSWKRQSGDIEELAYTIRDWKLRAQAFV